KEPIVTYKILKKKEKPEEKRGLSGFDIRFIGREAEINVLLDRFEDLKINQGSIVYISGEAGLGKSRLIREFYNNLTIEGALQEVGGNIKWLFGEAFSFQINHPYALLIDLLNRYFDIELSMNDNERADVITQKLNEIAASLELRPYILTILNITLPPEDQAKIVFLEANEIQRNTNIALNQLFEIIANLNPLILVFDDVHWIDHSSSKIIEFISTLTKDKSILIIFLSRNIIAASPLFHYLNGEIFDNKFELPIENLNQEKAKQLISNLLKSEDLPTKLIDNIVERSQGNPFFVEETIRSLIDQDIITQKGDTWIVQIGIEDIKIPDNLAALIQTRLDQLNEMSRRVAQTASVIGREFLYEILNCLTSEIDVDTSLADLENKNLILQDVYNEDKQYFFRHVFSREVAYNSLLLKTRRDLHKRTAKCLMNINHKQIAEIGRHLFEAREYHEAIPFIIENGNKALKANATSEAIEIFKQVHQVMGDEIHFDLTKEVLVGLGTALTLNGKIEESDKIFNELYTKSKEKSDQKGIVTSLNKLASNIIYGNNVEITKAEEYIEQADAIANIIQFNEGLIEIAALRCVMYQSDGRFADSFEAERTASQISSQANDEHTAIYFKVVQLNSLIFNTKFDDAKDFLKQIHMDLEGKNYPFITSMFYVFGVQYIEYIEGNPNKAIEFLEKAKAIAAEINAGKPFVNANINLIFIQELTADYVQCWSNLKEIYEIRDVTNMAGMTSIIDSRLLLLSEVFDTSLLVNFDSLMSEIDETLTTNAGKFWETLVFADLGLYYLRKGEFEKGEKYLKSALEVNSAPMWIFRPYVLENLAKCKILQNDLQNSNLYIEQCIEYINERNMINIFGQQSYFIFGLNQLLQGNHEEGIKHLKLVRELAKKTNYRFILWKSLKILSLVDTNDQDINTSKAKIVLEEILAPLENNKEIFNLSNRLRKLEESTTLLDFIF
ncbi:MAG: AAA family ATPase, partial [Candidatus Heimdallarchaeota archaeon]|nr:AAA family ATPase [Candidatus Heimdallarchaeota archaeon]